MTNEPPHAAGLTRRQLLAAPWAVGALAGSPALAQEPRIISYRPYARCLPDHLRALAQEAYGRRNAAVAALTTSDAISRRQQWVRDTLWKLIGGQPERTPLHARVLSSFERPGYRVEKVVYESQAGLVIPANLYIPTGVQPPYPGVLFQPGHSLNGKSYPAYQKCCQGLARLGYVVLTIDPMGQGERIYYPNGKGSTRLRSADDEHTVAGRQMLLTGQTATQLQLWDAVRSLDYLAAHPLVDPARLGATGQSGGGTLTMLLAAVDDRLSAAVVSCGNTENFACANFNPPGSTDDAEQNFLGAGPLGFDRWDLLYPFAPKPLLLMASARDYFGTYSPSYLESGREEFRKLRAVYGVLGQESRIAWTETPLPHALAHELRMGIYNWFERSLKRSSRSVDQEPEVAPESDDVLRVGATGNVMNDFRSRTPQQLTRSRARGVPTPASPAALETLLRVQRPQAAATFRRLGVASAPGQRIVEAVEVAAAPHVWLPAWLFHPPRADPQRPVLLTLEPQGRNARWQEGALYQTLAERGCTVCAADVRGTGDLSCEVGRGAAAYTKPHADEENYAWAGLMLGRPLVGQRVTDVLALLHALRSHEGLSGRRIVLAAIGPMTIPALFAAALDPDVHALYMASGLASYRHLAEAEEYDHPLVNLLPNVLAHTDLPQLAAVIAPRKVTLAGTVDATGKTMDSGAVRALYGDARHITVEAEAGWNAEQLAAL